MAINLILAIFWLLIGLALLLFPFANPAFLQRTIWGSQFSIGWVALLLSLYNWLKVGFRYYTRRQKTPGTSPVRRPSRSSPSASVRQPQPDPNFQFRPDAPPGDEKSQ
jgi:hypothetical protein